MRMLILILVIGMSVSFAKKGEAPSAKVIQKLAAQYQIQQDQSAQIGQLRLGISNLDHETPHCYNSEKSSCVDKLCEKVYCGREETLFKVANACAGNFDGECVSAACEKVYCGSESTALNVAESCRGNYGRSCVETACSYVYCGREDTIINVLNSCKNTKADCVKSLCSKVYCGQEATLIKVLNACGGH